MRRVRAIYAVAKKEFVQLVRYPTWIIQLIIWPLIFPLMYILSALSMVGPDGSGLKGFETITSSNSFVGFIVVGTMAWMWVNTTMWSFSTSLRDEQMRGTLESNWLCPINKFDLLIGSGMICIFQSIIITVISVIEYRFIYGVHFTGNAALWLLMFIIMLPGVYGFGSVFASLILWAKEANAAVNLARGLMMILCGITFPVSIMPHWMNILAKGLPFTFGIEAARQIMVNGESLYAALNNILMCLIEGVIYLILGRLAFIRIENKVKESGSLERF